MYKINIQDTEYETSKHEGKLLLNGKKFDWDITKIDESRYHAIYRHQSYNLEVEQIDIINKSFIIKVNGVSVFVTGKDDMDILLDRLGMSEALSQVVKDVQAPMPGLILDIAVKVGDKVEKGDKLLILEAMKMENVVKSPSEGVVTSIQVEKGNNVEKNQVLIVFE